MPNNILTAIRSGCLALCLLAAAFPAAAQLDINSATGFARTEGKLPWITLETAASNIYLWLQGIAVSLALLAIVVGGIMYILSLGDEARAGRAKRIVLYAVIGLIIIGIIILILQTICQVLNIQTSACLNLNPPATLPQIISNIGDFLLGLVVFLAFAAVVAGGVMYIMALGDESRVARAKRIILGAVIGIMIAGLYQAIVYAVCEVVGQSIAGTPCANTLDQIVTIVLRAINVFLIMLTPLAVGAMVYGGYLYITSLGQEDRAAQGKRVILYALFGIIITVLAAMIVNVFAGVFI
jgi:hypothetical protein